jgi:uncharacterized protein YndB with AHSA1/START domain
MKTNNSEQVLIIQEFDAPRELVFKVWTDAKHLENWYAPEGCEIKIRKFDFRVGGQFLHCIYNDAFGDCWCAGVFEEIIEPEKIVYQLSLSDENGNPVETAQTNHDREWPASTLVTVTFEAIGNNRTRITLHQAVSLELAKRTGAYPGWLSMLGKLEAVLSAELVMH